MPIFDHLLLIGPDDWNPKPSGFLQTHRPFIFVLKNNIGQVRTRGVGLFLPVQVKLSSTTAAALMLCL